MNSLSIRKPAVAGMFYPDDPAELGALVRGLLKEAKFEGVVPKAVIALLSALYFHRITTEIPHDVSIALPRGTARPRLAWPPLSVYWFSTAMYAIGIETRDRDGVPLRVYSAAKTVVDCFRFRNRLGTDVAVEALRNGLEERLFTPSDLVRLASACRMQTVVRPYLEALQ